MSSRKRWNLKNVTKRIKTKRIKRNNGSIEPKLPEQSVKNEHCPIQARLCSEQPSKVQALQIQPVILALEQKQALEYVSSIAKQESEKALSNNGHLTLKAIALGI